MDGALKHYHRTIALRETLAKEEPASVEARLSPTFAYARLSDLHAGLASNEAAPLADRIENWRAARAWRQKSLVIFLDPRERGLLPCKHAAKPDEITCELARCDEALAKLQGALAATSNK